MASLIVAGDTSGSVTIAAPAIASTPTLTLPTVSGTFITTGSSGQSIPKAALPTGSVVQVQNAFSSTVVTAANSGSGRLYVDLLTIAYTPVSASNKIILLGTSGFGSLPSTTGAGAFGVTFNVNGTEYEFSNYPWYSGVIRYPTYPPESSISRTLNVPTSSAFNIKFRGFSYNESSGTMSTQFQNYQLTVIEVVA